MSGSLRKALELSTTMTPASANFCASAREVVAPGGEQRDVEAARVGGGGVLDGDALPTVGAGVRQHGAGRALRGEEPEVADREAALREDLAHRDADLAGGADDADVEGARAHRPVPP